MRDEVSRAIHKASGLLQAAGRLDMRADEFRTGAITLKRQRLAIAAVLSSEADKLRDLAVTTRAAAERNASSSRTIEPKETK